MSRVFRMLLAAYPRDFRRAYRADMELLFAERFADARRAGTATSFVVRTGANLLATGAAERWARIRSAQRGNLIQVRRVKMTGIGQDISYAIRLLRRQPSFSLFVILTLAP